MRKLIFFGIILLSSNCLSQENTSSECRDGIQEAHLDFKNGKAYFDYSRIDIEFNSEGDFENFYQIFMFSKYSIERDFYLNHKSEKEQCYYAKMDTLIRKKYGNDIFLKSRRKAKEIFDLGERSKKAEILDSTKFYIQSESPAKFIGNDMDIIKSLKKMFKYAPENKSELEYRSIGLLISKNGIVVDFKSHTDIPLESYTKTDIMKELNSLGAFLPAFLYDSKVNSILWIHLNSTEW